MQNFVKCLILALAVLLVMSSAASAQNVGIYIRPDFSSMTDPVTGQTWVLNSTDNTIYVWNGSAFVPGSTSATNGLYAPLSLTQGPYNAHYFYKTGGSVGAPGFNPIMYTDLPTLPVSIGGLGQSVTGGNDKLLVGHAGVFEEIPAPTGIGQSLKTSGSWTGTGGASDFLWGVETNGSVDGGLQYQMATYLNAGNTLDGNTDFLAQLGVVTLGHAGSTPRDGSITLLTSTGASVLIDGPTGTNSTHFVYPNNYTLTGGVLQNTGLGYTQYVDPTTLLTSYHAGGPSFTAVAGQSYGVNTSSGAGVCTLPDASTCTAQTIFVSLQVAGNPLTFNTYGGQTINGLASGSLSISTQYQCVMLMSTGSGWIRMY